MHVIVVGAGIIGVCTAYFLRRAGMDVTVVERRPGVAQETSFANAGVMAPSYVAPWAQPGMPGKVAAYLFKAEAPIVFRPAANLALWNWIRRWLTECSAERFARNKARMQRLAFYSQEQIRALRKLHALDYEQSTGYLQLFRTEQEVERSAATRKMLTELGVAHRLLTGDEARAVEVALHPGHAARGRAAPARRRDRQLRVLRAPAEGHRGARRRAVPLRRDRPGLRPGAGPHRVPAHERRRTARRRVRHRRRGRQPRVAASARHPAAADGREGLFGDGRHHGARAGSDDERDGRDLQGRDHAHGQPPADRRHGGNRHQRHEAARQRAEHADQGRERLVSRRGLLPQGAVLGRRAPHAARRPAGARRRARSPTCSSTPDTAPPAGSWRAVRARCWPTSSEAGHRRSISTG